MLSDEQRAALGTVLAEGDAFGMGLARGLTAWAEELVADAERRGREAGLRDAAMATLDMSWPASADPDVWGAWLLERADWEATNPPQPRANNDRCVICANSSPRHGGLCCEHRYDEQPPCDRCVTPPGVGDSA